MKENAQIIIYETADGVAQLEVSIQEETVWLNQEQLAILFDKTKQNISLHINNIFKEGELKKNSVVKESLTTAADGKNYRVKYYNLDVIISVGYRVKSKRGTQFRIWATKILKDFLVEGYAINERRLKESEIKYAQLIKIIDIAASASSTKNLNSSEAEGILKVLQDYAYALDTLDRYDHQSLTISTKTEQEVRKLDYTEAVQLINDWRRLQDGTQLFGNEKDASFKSSLESIYQTFDGIDLYPSIEEKAANLLYFIVKNHSFSDGNKRIAAGLFVYFMDKNKILYHQDGSKRIADNALVAITIMIAESKPKEKDLMVKLVVNLINENN